jgi:23S rRNA (cytosine1962-C5)-methyltransferase
MLPEIFLPDSNEAQRIFHGRGHFYPGFEDVTIDWLPPMVLISLFRAREASWIKSLAKWVCSQIDQVESVAVQYRYQKGAPFENIQGVMPSDLVVTEDGLKYHLNFYQQNSGLFLDMANGRRWVQQIAQGRCVLNLFAYTCAFSVAARAGGAEKVLNIDLSRRALTTGRENHRLNGLDTASVYFESVDVFRSYGRMKKRGPFDLLISDPPTFQKGSVDIKRDYPKLIRRLPELLAEQAELLLCLNSPDLGADYLLEQVENECPNATFIEALKTPEVYREVNPNAGLKALRFRYIAP